MSVSRCASQSFRPSVDISLTSRAEQEVQSHHHPTFHQSSILLSSQIVKSTMSASVISLQQSSTSRPAPLSTCAADISTPPSQSPACAVLSSDLSANVLSRCCLTAPRVAFNANCNIYCDARGQTLEDLSQCIAAGLNAAARGGASDAVRCNRAGASFSSLLPTETSSSPTRTTGTLGAATSTGAAVRAQGIGKVFNGSFGVLFMVVVFFMEGFYLLDKLH